MLAELGPFSNGPKILPRLKLDRVGVLVPGDSLGDRTVAAFLDYLDYLDDRARRQGVLVGREPVVETEATNESSK